MKFTIQLELTVDVDVTTKQIGGGNINPPIYSYQWDDYTYSLIALTQPETDLTEEVGSSLEDFITNHLNEELQESE